MMHSKVSSLISNYIKDKIGARLHREDNEPFACYCNICGSRAPFKNINKRKSVCCAVCGSYERHRHLYIHLLALIPFFNGKKFLHFAPEKILQDVILSSGADLEYYDADYAPGRATYETDIRNINFEDNFFDYILASHVLEHIDDDAKAIKELYRVLKPGGRAILLVPYMHQYQKGICFRTDGTSMPHLMCKNPDETFELEGKKSAQECFKLYGQDDHVRIYGLADFVKRLERQNFRVEVAYVEYLPNALKKRARLVDEIVFAYKD